MRTESAFAVQVQRKDGLLEDEQFFHNLTTDGASGYTNRRDWQSKLMGLADTDADYQGDATAATSTTLTNSGASFPTSGQGLDGRVVLASRNSSGTGSTVFGVIVSNTGTALTVDQWYDPTDYSVGTTPNGTASYTIMPGSFPAPYIAVTENSDAPADTDTTLTGELTSDGFSRALATFSHTAAADNYNLNVVFNATGTHTIEKCAVAGSAVADLGAFPFTSLVPDPPTLVSGDQLTIDDTVTVN